MAKLNLFRAAILGVALVGAASCYMAPSAGDEEMTMPAAEEGMEMEDSMESGDGTMEMSKDMDEMDHDGDMDHDEDMEYMDDDDGGDADDDMETEEE